MKNKLLHMVTQIRGPLLLTVCCGLLAAIATIVQMFLLSMIISRVFLTHQTQVIPLLLFLPVVMVLRAILLWMREVSAQRGATRVKTALRERLFAHVLRLGPAWSAGERTGELVVTASEGIERLDGYVGRYLPQIALSVLVPLLIIGALLPVDGISAALLLLTGPIIPLLMFLVGSHTEKHVQRQWLALSRMSAHFLDVVQGLTTLKLFGRDTSEQERVARISENHRKRTMSVLRMAFLSGAVLEFMAAAAIGLIAVTLGVRLLDQGITFEQALLVLLLAPEFYRPLRDLGTHRHTGMEGKVAAQRVIEILETLPPIQKSADLLSLQHSDGNGRQMGLRGQAQGPHHLPLREKRSRGNDNTSGNSEIKTDPFTRPTGALNIEIAHLTYTYPSSEVPALKDVSLSLPVGSCTALVGRSGAGKSTLAHLLLRFINADSGSILVNNIPLDALPPETWREYLALVPQRPYLFCASIYENIRLARPGASEQEIEWAAEQAGAASFIRQMGFATQVGERGARLSAGQVQRIAIARAFLKNAPLLMLDEPTSCLDPESETLIRQAVARLTQDRTVLIIAHRANTIAQASQVAILDQGRLVEVGQPAELGRLYTRLLVPQGREQIAR